MAVSEKYKLSGYIEYISSPVGFVTPVFMDDDGKYCIQVSTGQSRICEWDFLPEVYMSRVSPVDSTEHEAKGVSFIYGFKRDQSFFFGSGQEMAKHLTELSNKGLGQASKLADNFVQKWKSLEPVEDKFTKESIWNESMEIVKIVSSAMLSSFRESIETKLYINGVLFLSIKNVGVKKIFEDKFKERLTAHFKKQNSNFDIVIQQNEKSRDKKAIVVTKAESEKQKLKATFNRHYTNLVYYVNKIIKDEASAEEIASDIFVEFYAEINKFNSDTKISKHLLKVAWNKSIDYLRRTSVNRKKTDYYGVDSDAISDAIIDEGFQNRSEVIMDALDLLPTETKKVMELIYLENLTVRQVAQLLQATQKSIGDEKNKGLGLIRQILLKGKHSK